MCMLGTGMTFHLDYIYSVSSQSLAPSFIVSFVFSFG